MDRPIVAVVAAGGTGTRLYPASRSDRPKQFLPFGGDRSLLARTIDRASFADRRVVVAGPDHAGRAREHAPDADLLVEPEARDTGPALVYAAAHVRDQYPDDEPVVVCLPSDHRIDGPFASVARKAARVAVETRGLVTVGIDPTRPATGYGYVTPGREEDSYAPVEQFHEKPDADTARDLIDRGARWNAGIFAWLPGALLDEARRSPLAGLVEAVDDGDPERGYRTVESVSIDYAVLERADHAFVVPAPPALEWDDMGTWDALGRVLESDAAGNTITSVLDDPGDDDDGSGSARNDPATADDRALTIDASDTVIATDDVHVTAIGVSDLAVVAVDDRVLVVPRDESERVREAVERLRDRGLF